MNSSGFDQIVTRCKIMERKSDYATSPIVRCRGLSETGGLRDCEADRIIDFLDSKTDGEDILHALYDHVLDEPVPERMRALFKAIS